MRIAGKWLTAEENMGDARFNGRLKKEGIRGKRDRSLKPFAPSM
jgi:hypothetical protein